MKKVIRLTESDLTNVVKKVIKEQINESFLKNFLSKLFKSGSKPVPKFGTPLLSQLPSKVQTMIQSFPKQVKLGDKLKNVFNTHSHDIRSLEHYIKSQGGNGIADTYARSLAKSINVPKGSIVNLQSVYSNAHFLKKELENIISNIPKPKQGGILNKNKNYDKQMDELYNKFYTETATLNRFISDLEKVRQSYRPR
jgi:hypothetical protein